MSAPLHIAVACGGTGGHVMPGLATATALRDRGHRVTLWLTGKALEDQSIAGWDGPIVRVPAQGLPNRLSWAGIVSAYRIARAARRCRAIMRTERPDAVLAMGSYASAGPAWAARRLGIPYVLHEANVIPGRAIRFFARHAAAVACHFEETRFYLQRGRIVVTGMPLRAELNPAQAQPLSDLPDVDACTLLIMGGSHGAHALNELGTEAVAGITAAGYRIRVLHLTGTADADWVRDRYAEAGVTAWVRPFAKQMAGIYQATTLALCRAGASTCAELSCFGVPALLVPYPHAANQHQEANARALEKAGGADVVLESNLTAAWLMDYIKEALDHPKRLARMSAALKRLTPTSSATRLAEVVEASATASN